MDKPLIEIHADLKGAELAELLLHEAGHAIWKSKRLRHRETEECAIKHLSAGLIVLFRDNPRLLSHLETLIKEAR